MRKITLTQKLTNGQDLMRSDCCEWITNGHWMVRSHLIRSVPPSLSGRRPPAASLLYGLPLDKYRIVGPLYLTLQGFAALADSSANIIGWADPRYLAMLLSFGLPLWADTRKTPTMSPIVVMEGPNQVMAALMPTREPEWAIKKIVLYSEARS